MTDETKTKIQFGEYKNPDKERRDACQQMTELLHGVLDKDALVLGLEVVNIICGDGNIDHPIEIRQNPHFPKIVNVVESLGGGGLKRMTAIQTNDEGEAVGFEMLVHSNELGQTTDLMTVNSQSEGGTKVVMWNSLNSNSIQALPERFDKWREEVTRKSGHDSHFVECTVIVSNSFDYARAISTGGRNRGKSIELNEVNL